MSLVANDSGRSPTPRLRRIIGKIWSEARLCKVAVLHNLGVGRERNTSAGEKFAVKVERARGLSEAYDRVLYEIFQPHHAARKFAVVLAAHRDVVEVLDVRDFKPRAGVERSGNHREVHRAVL